MLGIAFVLLRTFEQLADTFVTAIVPFYGLAVAVGLQSSTPSGLRAVVSCARISDRARDISSLHGLSRVEWPDRAGESLADGSGVRCVVLGIPVYWLTFGRAARGT